MATRIAMPQLRIEDTFP